MPRSARSSPAISAAAAPSRASFARSSARPACSTTDHLSEEPPMNAPASLDLPSRRAFLQSAALVVTFAATGAPRDAVAQQTASFLAPPRAFDPNTVGGYLAVGGDGRVTIYSGKIDWGTGV